MQFVALSIAVSAGFLLYFSAGTTMSFNLEYERADSLAGGRQWLMASTALLARLLWNAFYMAGALAP